MERTYSTVSGQTWDQIAYEIYGDEHHCDILMDANRELLDYFVFPAEITLQVPDADIKRNDTIHSDYPEWRAALDG